MADKSDVLKESLSRFLTGFALSKAIFEDYVKVIAKLENVPEQEVKDRVWQRADDIYKETIEKQKQQIDEAS